MHISTIGLRSGEGAIIEVDGYQIATTLDEALLADIDEPTLQAVAEITGGSHFRAQDADQLLDAFLDLPNDVTLQHEDVELTV